MIKGVTVLTNIGLYISPIVLLYLWRNGYSVETALFSSAKLAAGFTLLVLVSVLIRGVGRYLNPAYHTFMECVKNADMKHAEKNLTYSVLAEQYDCSFSALPVVFKRETTSSTDLSFFTKYLTPGGLFAMLLGRPLIYPGSIQLLQAALGPYLEEGRTTLMRKHGGKRAKIQAADSNEIDTVFIDRRNR